MKITTCKIRTILQSFLCFFLATILSVPTFAISDALWDEYGINGIYYYDPTGKDSNCTTFTSGNNITIIGDSITDGSKSDIQQLLPDAKIYSQVSKHFGNSSDQAISASDTDTNPSGFSIAKYLSAEGSLGSTVVFALGTNDTLNQTQVNDLLDFLGPNRTIYFITNYDANGAHSQYTTNNNILTTAATNKNVHLIDWVAAASQDPGKYIKSDGIHPTPDGSKLFAELIDKAVGGSTSTTSGPNGNYTNYAGDKVLSDKQIGMLESNVPIYEQAIRNTNADSYGINWRILATVHYKETALGRRNPANGQGIYQLYSLYTQGITFPASDSVSEEEFLRQTELAITEKLIPTVTSYDLKLSNEDDVKKLFFAYNGMASIYKEKALAMGYSQYQANIGEGSIYVMNAYDAPRDPFHIDTMNDNWRGAFVSDGVYDPDAVKYTYGAYTVYSAMGGATYCSADIASGGLSLENAKIFMNDYIYNVNCSDWKINCSHKSTGGAKANCVTFTQYFIARFTSAGVISPTGDGGWVVSNLTGTDTDSSHGKYRHTWDYSQKGFQYGGFEPRPYAIFSTWKGITDCGNVKCGHTGVVLGINQSENKIYIGQAGYNQPLIGYSDVVEKNLSDYTNGDYWFAYTDNIVNTTAISQIIGN